MKYFLHDTNAFQDEKVTQLFMQFGYEGVGLFFTLLEKLAMQEKPIKTEVLKKQLFVGKKLEKAWNFMEEIELISSNNGETFNEQLLNYSEKYQIKKEKNRERIAEWRKNQDNSENVTCYKNVRNNPKVNKSKVKESKDIGEPRPTLEQVISYCKERNNLVDPKKWFDHYEANGWKVGKVSMKNWQAAVRTWERNNLNNETNSTTNAKKHDPNIPSGNYHLDWDGNPTEAKSS
jgi:hypothetical protein